MSDKWTGKQKGDAEFTPKAPPTPALPAPPPPPGTFTKSTIDRWVEEYRPLLDGPGRRYSPHRDLDFRPRYSPRYETATEKRELEREWERNKGRIVREVESDLKRRLELDMLYMRPMYMDGSKVVAQRIMLFDGDVERARLDVPTEKQTKLAELFDKAANVPGYMHWWAESDPARMEQTRAAAAEIVGALRYDEEYWRPAFPEVFEYAAWIARAIVDLAPTRIKVESVRSGGGLGIFTSGIVA